jgi:hypothetical protein
MPLDSKRIVATDHPRDLAQNFLLLRHRISLRVAATEILTTACRGYPQGHPLALHRHQADLAPQIHTLIHRFCERFPTDYSRGCQQIFPAIGLSRDNPAPQPLPQRACTVHVERMIDQPLDLLYEADGVRQFGVKIERRFVAPTGVNVEQPGITDRAIGLLEEAAFLGLRRAAHLAQRLGDGGLLAFAGVEASKNEQFHGVELACLKHVNDICACIYPNNAR